MSTTPNWLQIVRSLLHENLIEKGRELREEDPDSKCCVVKIHGSGKDVILSFNAEINGVCIRKRRSYGPIHFPRRAEIRKRRRTRAIREREDARRSV